jgi:hypothetical protein
MAKYGKDIKYHKRFKPVHGHMVITHPIYGVWANIKDRCYNTDSASYANYGGRGIRMCNSWYMSFEAFALDMGLRPSVMHTIDRLKIAGGQREANSRVIAGSSKITQQVQLALSQQKTDGLLRVLIMKVHATT